MKPAIRKKKRTLTYKITKKNMQKRTERPRGSATYALLTMFSEEDGRPDNYQNKKGWETPSKTCLKESSQTVEQVIKNPNKVKPNLVIKGQAGAPPPKTEKQKNHEDETFQGCERLAEFPRVRRRQDLISDITLKKPKPSQE